MTRPLRPALAALNVIGGVAVLASYAWGLSQPAIASGLWGHVPETLRGLYTVNMLLAALGYFPFSALLVLSADEGWLRVFVQPRTTLGLYALVLAGSALWLPLTSAMIASPSALVWLAVRVDLGLVAVGAVGILASVLRVARGRGGALAWLAVAGALPFVLQTAVLDAIVWPYYWFG